MFFPEVDVFSHQFSASDEKRLSTPQIMGRDAETNQHQENEVTDSSTEESSSDDWEDEEMHRRRQPSMKTLIYFTLIFTFLNYYFNYVFLLMKQIRYKIENKMPPVISPIKVELMCSDIWMTN